MHLITLFFHIHIHTSTITLADVWVDVHTLYVRTCSEQAGFVEHWNLDKLCSPVVKKCMLNSLYCPGWSVHVPLHVHIQVTYSLVENGHLGEIFGWPIFRVAVFSSVIIYYVLSRTCKDAVECICCMPFCHHQIFLSHHSNAGWGWLQNRPLTSMLSTMAKCSSQVSSRTCKGMRV